jgi:hypothetical protein
MKTKTFYLFLSLAIIIAGVGFVGISKANAQVASFPSGCASGLGYSVTTGNACNGNSSGYVGFLPGCSSALGYSTVNGVPCSGGSVALVSYLAGCSSVYGYSTINGWACNGTRFGPAGGGTVSSPGFPVTDFGGNTLLNTLLLLGLGISASISFKYLMRFSSKS